MVILGIDYGRAKIGLAKSEGYLAAPWKVIRVTSRKDASEKIGEMLQLLKVQKVVVGVSEGAMGQEQEMFAQELGHLTGLEVVLWDEGLTTHDAQNLALESGRGQKKRREMEDAYAATLVLQSYIDLKIRIPDD